MSRPWSELRLVEKWDEVFNEIHHRVHIYEDVSGEVYICVYPEDEFPEMFMY